MSGTDVRPPTPGECSPAGHPVSPSTNAATPEAAALPGRLAALPIAEVVTSPLQRCQETLQPLLDARPGLRAHTDERIEECHYGDWSGRKLARAEGRAPHGGRPEAPPSAAAFPGGESMRSMQTRAAEAVREWNARVERDHGTRPPST
ncbi:histidine phosphatase family protein [Streptomyces sp. L7]